MFLVYVIGPYTAQAQCGIDANIARAVERGIEVAELGAMPVIPHANTGDPRFLSIQSPEFWYAGTLELLRACHAAITVPGWKKSVGSREEARDVIKRAQPLFHHIDDLETWISDPSMRPDVWDESGHVYSWIADVSHMEDSEP